ncbi:MAG: hypothetical protein ACSLEW_14940 [Nocardioides sp.]
MYGTTSSDLRDALGILLRQHRIQQRLGGPGIHTVPETTTRIERAVLGARIRRYRHAVLTWTQQALRAVHPTPDLHTIPRDMAAPIEEFSTRLNSTLAHSTAGLPAMAELSLTSRFEIVEAWRAAARAAAFGEHDLADYGAFSYREALTLLADACDITRALVVLDRRYSLVPDWEPLHHAGWLSRAADAARVTAKSVEADYRVDLHGRRPAPQLDTGAAEPGVDGVIQAVRNTLVSLQAFPDAHTLRLVLDSQRVLSHELATRVPTSDLDLDLGERWTHRRDLYRRLIQHTRDLDGILGTSHAAGSASLAATRAQNLDHRHISDAQAERLRHLLGRIDDQIGRIIEHGARHRLYAQRLQTLDLDQHPNRMIQRPTSQFVPITTTLDGTLLHTIREELRPAITRQAAPQSARQSREDLEAAIHHRPTPRFHRGSDVRTM